MQFLHIKSIQPRSKYIYCSGGVQAQADAVPGPGARDGGPRARRGRPVRGGCDVARGPRLHHGRRVQHHPGIPAGEIRPEVSGGLPSLISEEILTCSILVV